MSKLFSVIGILLIIGMFIGVCYSGIHYVFDGDEFHHVQVAYLFSRGEQAYRTFYLTPYTPVFHWVLKPFINVSPSDFMTMVRARYVMVGIFLIRCFIVYFFVRRLADGRAAVFVLSLLLIEPIISYSVIQIRPDNLMIPLYLLALLLFSLAWDKKKEGFSVLSGIMAALSGLTLLKIGPSIIIFGIFVCACTLMQRKYNLLRGFLAGGALTIILFCAYFLIQGTLNQMITEVLVYPRQMFAALAYPVPFGFYHRSDNTWIYGVGGKPLTWYFGWGFFFLMGAGIYSAFSEALHHKNFDIARGFLVVLALSCIVQLYWVMTLPSVFIQYYQPAFVFGAIVAGYAIFLFLKRIAFVGIRNIFYVGFLCILSYMSYYVIQYNQGRGQMTWVDQKTQYEQIWSVIPENEPVFPTILFRPLVYPFASKIPYADTAPYFFLTFPDVYKILTTKPFKYHLYEQYYNSFLPENARAYIYDNFVPSGTNNVVYIRK